MAYRPITDEEGSKGGQRSMMLFGVVAGCMIVATIFIGLASRENVAPNTAPMTTELPATSGAQTPQ